MKSIVCSRYWTSDHKINYIQLTNAYVHTVTIRWWNFGVIGVKYSLKLNLTLFAETNETAFQNWGLFRCSIIHLKKLSTNKRKFKGWITCKVDNNWKVTLNGCQFDEKRIVLRESTNVRTVDFMSFRIAISE